MFSGVRGPWSSRFLLEGTVYLSRRGFLLALAELRETSAVRDSLTISSVDSSYGSPLNAPLIPAVPAIAAVAAVQAVVAVPAVAAVRRAPAQRGRAAVPAVRAVAAVVGGPPSGGSDSCGGSGTCRP